MPATTARAQGATPIEGSLRELFANRCSRLLERSLRRPLTVKLRAARSTRRQTKALYPEHRHGSEPLESSRASPPALVRGRVHRSHIARARRPASADRSQESLAARASAPADRRVLALALQSHRCLSIGVLGASSNGEAEGPRRSPSPWRRGRKISSRPRRQPGSASRTPPTIVRWHEKHQAHVASSCFRSPGR